MALCEAYGERLAECDRELEARLARLQRHGGDPAPGKRRAKAKNAPDFDVRGYLFRRCGGDLTRMDGIDVTTALTVSAEVGPDLSRFKSAKHFASWLGLCPGTKLSGGQRLSGPPSARRTGPPRPSVAAAAAPKLARLIDTLLTQGTAYADRGQDSYDERYRQRVLHHLNRKTASLGFKLVAMEPVSA